MAKSRTSKKPKNISISDLPIVKLRPGVKTRPFDPLEGMGDRKGVLESLVRCLGEGDAEGFKDILAAHLHALNKKRLTRKLGMGRTTLYEALGPDGNPSLQTITKIVKAIVAGGT